MAPVRHFAVLCRYAKCRSSNELNMQLGKGSYILKCVVVHPHAHLNAFAARLISTGVPRQGFVIGGSKQPIPWQQRLRLY